MSRFFNLPLVLLLVAGLAGSAAFAAGGGGHGGSEAAEEGHESADTHHVTYSDDDDGDGAANWRDPDSGAYVVPKVLQHLFNLAIFGAILVTYARRPATDAMKNRAAAVRLELEEAARMRDEARAEHQELNRRLDAFKAEVEAMRAQAIKELALDEELLMRRANESADRVRETARRNINEETVRARQALRAEAVELAVQLAEQALRGQVQPDDQRRLARDFLTSLEGSDGR